MTTLGSQPCTSIGRHEEAASQTSRSMWMIAVFVFAYLLTSFVGVYLIFPLLGLQEGDIFLFARSAGGWAAAVISWLVLIAGPIVGVVLAIRALHLEAGGRAWVALALNALAVLFTAYLMFDEMRMTYFPGFTFPFSG